MNKQFTVTFELDVETLTVSKLNCFVDGVESKKKTTRTSSSKAKDSVVLESTPMITLEANKYIFNNRAVADLELVWEDRVVIKYEKVEGQKRPVPIIGKDSAFDEEGTGNKLTKTNSVAYRGKANTILAEYGTEFELHPYKGDVYQLIPAGGNPVTYKDVVEEAEKLDVTIITDEEEEDQEIGEMDFKLS